MLNLQPRVAHQARVLSEGSNQWRLWIPGGPSGTYRCAQLDDYMLLKRSSFPWQPPVSLELRARVSCPDLNGTWGFGFWNDPFSMSFGTARRAVRFPALPNTAWFFFAGKPNYLAFHDNHPAQGFLAATFSSLPLPFILLSLGAPLAPLLAWPAAARLLRRAARILIKESAVQVSVDPTGWHTYRIECRKDGVQFFVDQVPVYKTAVVPKGKLGLALWIDNQYAAFPPDGRVRMGDLSVPEEAWIEIEQISAG